MAWQICFVFLASGYQSWPETRMGGLHYQHYRYSMAIRLSNVIQNSLGSRGEEFDMMDWLRCSLWMLRLLWSTTGGKARASAALTSKCQSMSCWIFVGTREMWFVSYTFSNIFYHDVDVVSRSQLHIIVATVMLPLWLKMLQSDPAIKVSKMMTSAKLLNLLMEF